jgi:hypothetical protein
MHAGIYAALPFCILECSSSSSGHPIDHGVFYLSAIDCSDRTEGVQKIQYMLTIKK